MAEGRGSAASLVAVAVLALHGCALAVSAATYRVGGSQGWEIGPDYAAWAAGYNFTVGDILFFPYAATQHNVVEVDKAGYDGCSASNAIATYSDGNTNVTLTSTGTHYFICSFPGHCGAGMKLAVVVSASAAAPSSTVAPAPVPSASSPSPPAPASSATPPSTTVAPAPVPSASSPSPSSLANPPAPASAAATSPVPAPVSSPSPGASLTPPPPSNTLPLSPSPPSNAAPLPPSFAALRGTVMLLLAGALLAM